MEIAEKGSSKHPAGDAVARSQKGLAMQRSGEGASVWWAERAYFDHKHYLEKFGFDRTLLTKWWASSPIARGASRRRASLAIGGAKMEDHHDARAEESDSSQGWLTGTRQAARQRVAGLQGDGIQPR